MYNHLTLQMYDPTLTALAGYVGKAECLPSSTTVERLQTLQQWKFASCPDAGFGVRRWPVGYAALTHG